MSGHSAAGVARHIRPTESSVAGMPLYENPFEIRLKKVRKIDRLRGACCSRCTGLMRLIIAFSISPSPCLQSAADDGSWAKKKHFKSACIIKPDIIPGAKNKPKMAA
jgi:hypothetical protein